MFVFFKKKNKNVGRNAEKEVRESPEIKKARKWLEETYYYKPFNYLKTTTKGEFKRHHFCLGLDKRIIYVVLSDKETNEVIKVFTEKMGASYRYHSTIITNGSGILHRFCRLNSGNTLFTFMNEDDGEIWGGNFAMGEDME